MSSVQPILSLQISETITLDNEAQSNNSPLLANLTQCHCQRDIRDEKDFLGQSTEIFYCLSKD